MKHHPEQAESEIYMGNTTAEGMMSSSWRTSRLGNVAYNRDGAVIPGQDLLPWFVQRREVEEQSARVAEKKEFRWEEIVRLYQDMLSTGRISIAGTIV